jgi:hypothetical protein
LKTLVGGVVARTGATEIGWEVEDPTFGGGNRAGLGDGKGDVSARSRFKPLKLCAK